MRLLVVSDLWLPFPGGAERLIFNVARHVARAGHDVAAVTGYEHAQRFDGPRLYVEQEIPLDPRGWRIIERAIDAHRPDVLLTHHLYAHTFHDDLVATGLPLVQLVLNGERMPEASVAVFISEWVRAQSPSRDLDLTIIPPAFDDVVADSHGDGIGFVKPIEHKGVELVYRLAKRLSQYRFVILRGEWQTLEIIEPEHTNITFMEPVVDMRDFWREVRLVLVPSLSEDAGTIAQEAAVNGVPCISSNREGLVETNGGGIRLDPERLGPWARTIRKLLDHPAQYAAVVESQRAWHDAQDYGGRLDELVRLMEKLA